MIAALGGAIVGVGVAAIVSTPLGFAVAGAVYLLSALVARAISTPMGHPHPGLERLTDQVVRVARELWEGVRAIMERPAARLPLTGIFIVRTSAMLMAIAAILLIKDTFAGTGRLGGSALALGAAGLGAFAGALSAPALGRHYDKPGLLLIGFYVGAAGMILSGLFLSLPTIIAMSFLGGYSSFVAKVAVDAQVQEAIPDSYRGRAFSLYDILYNLASVVAGVVMVVFDGIPLGARVVAGGLLVIALAWLLGRAMKRAGLTSSERPAAETT